VGRVTVALESLVGKHKLSGVDRLIDEDLAAQLGPANAFRFVLDGKTYIAVEDPEDGWRSAMKELYISDDPVTNQFSPIEVEATLVVGRRLQDWLGRDMGNEHQILQLRDVMTGKLILEVGTVDVNDWYPQFVAWFDPTGMYVNDDARVA